MIQWTPQTFSHQATRNFLFSSLLAHPIYTQQTPQLNSHTHSNSLISFQQSKPKPNTQYSFSLNSFFFLLKT